MGLKKRWWLSFILVVALLFVADFFVLHFLFPWKQAALLQATPTEPKVDPAD